MGITPFMLLPDCLMLLIETALGQFHESHIIKNIQRSLLGGAVGYFWHTAATNKAQDTPPRNPSLLEYKQRSNMS